MPAHYLPQLPLSVSALIGKALVFYRDGPDKQGGTDFTFLYFLLQYRMSDDVLMHELIDEVRALRLAVLAVAAAVLGKQTLDNVDLDNKQAAQVLGDLMKQIGTGE